MKILIIEDDLDDLYLLKSFLKKIKTYDFNISHSNTIKSGLEVIKNEDFDLIFLDLTLPDSRGIETIRKVIPEIRKIPLIVLTGIKDRQLVSEALRIGAQDFIVKGLIDVETLERAIYHSLERNKLVNELNNEKVNLELLSTIDPLTNILNRRGFEHSLQRVIKSISNNIHSILLDLDEFKKINDSFGHSTGDMVLKEVAMVLIKTVRSNDLVSRIGGDEFIVCISDVNDKTALKIADKIKNNISAINIKISGNFLKVTASLGLNKIPIKEITIDKILNKTEGALKASKESGRNCVSVAVGNEIKTQKPILDGKCKLKLFDIINNNEYIYTVKQPIINILSNEIYGYEFLIRSKIKELSSPSELFKTAYALDVITPFDFTCLKKCINSSYELLKEGHLIFLNILPTTLISDLTGKLVELILETGYADRFCLEISEQQVLGNPKHLINSVKLIKKAGIKIAIDDVGFGQTCLESLIMLKPDIAKIDLSCTIGICDDIFLQENMSRLIKVVEALDIKTIIIEGIENQSDLDYVKNLSIEYAQGFFWGIPQTIS